MDTIELRLTIDKEAIEAIFTLLGALAERESTKEKESNITNTNIASSSASSNNINNNNINTVDVDVIDKARNIAREKAINKVNEEANNEVDIPTLEDVKAYADACGYKMSSQKFYDYYKNNGWKTKRGVSLVGMWKGFVDNWAKAEYAHNDKPTGNKAGMGTGVGTVEESHKAHPFVPTQFTEDGKLA